MRRHVSVVSRLIERRKINDVSVNKAALSNHDDVKKKKENINIKFLKVLNMLQYSPLYT